MNQEQLERLKSPFPAEEVQWRAGATNKDDTKALALAYIDARAVMERLDEVVGPMNWTDTYDEWKGGAVKAGIGIRNEEGWVWKYDGADDSDFEATKGGFSDAFKRAAVKWGIGRYLYQLPAVWVPCQKYGKTVRLSTTPALPKWALPDGDTSSPRSEPQPEPTEEPTAEEPTTGKPKPWVVNNSTRGRFWGWAKKAGLSHDDVHTALGIDSLMDCDLDYGEAQKEALRWRDQQKQAEPEALPL